MPLEPLSEDDAAALLDHTAPDLPAPLRHRLLAAAHGNPLALTELPTAVAALDNLTTTLPVTERLEHAFTARSATLPGRTRTALLVAALNDSDSIDETLSATSVLLGTPAEVKILTPAVEARLLTLGPGNVAFRHPLMRSALIATATAEERARAHHSLADILTEYPDRRTWQRAAATASPYASCCTTWHRQSPPPPPPSSTSAGATSTPSWNPTPPNHISPPPSRPT